jgi:hypothetical protein
VVFVADDLGAWLVGVLAETGRKKLTTFALGTDQERALHQAATAAIGSTARELAPAGGAQAEQLAMVVNEVFGQPMPGAPLAEQPTLLQALDAGIAGKLAALDDAALTGTEQSSAEVLGVPGSVLAETLARHLIREIMLRGSRGGPLAPLADQLNHDVTHLQGKRLEGIVAHLVDQVATLERPGTDPTANRAVQLLPRPALLAGREELLGNLDARLSIDSSRGPRIVTLSGLGGVGKTSVAVEYAHRRLPEVGVVWQFAAEDPTVLAAGFAELAAQLGIRDLADTRDPVASVHQVLADFPGRWLLIFDNAADWASVQAFVPPAGAGQVLITSQNPNWPHGQAIEIPPLGTGVAAEFLINRTGNHDWRTAHELAEALGGLPLALEQAGAYIVATGVTLASYLGLFRQRRTDMLSRGEPTGYPRTVATTWALAFGQVERSSPEGAGLLRLVAYFAPDAIPLGVLLMVPHPRLAERIDQQVAPVLMPLLGDEVAAADAVAALRRYSLVSLPAQGWVLVHRLVQAVTTDQMPAELAGLWRRAAAALIEDAIPDDAKEPKIWPYLAAMLPHAQTVLADSSISMGRLANYLGARGSYSAALKLQTRVLAARRQSLGPEHPDTLSALGNIAHWTGEGGDRIEARDQYAALLPLMERVRGPEHPDTLAVRSNLAGFTGDAGDAVGARDQFTTLLDICKRVWGQDDPHTLLTAVQAARWTGWAGDAVGARDQLSALLPVQERVSGSTHQSTLRTREILANFTGHAGDAVKARDMYAALLPVMKQVLGPEHPDTLTVRADLANWTGMAGDAASARDQYAALLPIHERLFGPEHPDILAMRARLANWTGVAGDAATARDQYAALLPIHERLFGPEHPDTLAIRAHLANWTGQAGDAASARDQHAALLPVIKRVRGPEHPDTMTVHARLANWTGQARDAPGARDQYAALLPVIKRVRGPEHPDTLGIRAHLANWTGLAGDVADARDQYGALLPVIERVLGSEHPDTMTARANLAFCTEKARTGPGAGRR